MTSRNRGDSQTSESDGFVVVQTTEVEDTYEDEQLQSFSHTERSLFIEDDCFVSFSNVQRVYPTDQDIHVCFEKVRNFTCSERDFIALAHVGNTDVADVIASELVPFSQSVGPFFVTIKISTLAREFSYEDYFEFRYVLGDVQTVMGSSPKFHLIRSLRSESSLPLQGLSRERTMESSSPLVSLAPEPCVKCVELHSTRNQLEAALETKALLTAELKDVTERLDHLSNVYEVTLKENRELHTSLQGKNFVIKNLEKLSADQKESIADLTRSSEEKLQEIQDLKKHLQELNLERDNLFAQITSINSPTLSADAKEEYEMRIAVLEANTAQMKESVADKEAWIASLTTEVERKTTEAEKAHEKSTELELRIEHLEENMERRMSELLNTKDELAAAEGRCLSFEAMEEASVVRIRSIEEALEEKANELCSLLEKDSVLVEQIVSLTQERDDLRATVERLNELATEAEELRIQSMQFRLKSQEHEEEIERLRSALQEKTSQDEQKEKHSETDEIQDVDVLVKYLPSLTQTLIGMSNTEVSPNTQKVIKELRDMIRFLLTAHEKMKSEVRRLRDK